MLDSDGWARKVLRGIEEVTNDPSRWDEVTRSLTTIFDGIPKTKQDIAESVGHIEQLLSLPLWQRRADLYSAWIGAQIAKALGPSTRIHAVDGLLRYCFSGTHLATATKADGRSLHLWAELRSQLNSPKGKGRIHGIQPDYSIQLEPITYSESSVLVVECKQYLRASARTFANALDDYGRGRPRAQVALVNHGPAPQSILSRVDADVRSRTSIIANLQPRSEESLREFEKLIRSVANVGSDSVIPTTMPIREVEEVTATSALMSQSVNGNVTGLETSADTPHGAATSAVDIWGSVSLRWSEQPRDLDLHVWLIDETGQEIEINYQNLGMLQSKPWVALDQDCQHGFGPEIVNFAQLTTFRCAVFNYSNEVSLTTSGAVLQVSLGTLHMDLYCPETGSGRWWDALEYHAGSQQILIRGQVVENTSQRSNFYAQSM